MNQQTAPSAADAYPVVEAWDMRAVACPGLVAAGGRLDIAGLAFDLRSYRTAEEEPGCGACLEVALTVAWAAQRRVALRVNRRLIRHRRHWSRRAPVRSGKPGRELVIVVFVSVCRWCAPE